MFAQKAYHYVVITRVPIDTNKASDSAISVNVQYVYSRFQHKVSVALETHQVPALAIRSALRKKLMRCRLFYMCFYCFGY